MASAHVGKTYDGTLAANGSAVVVAGTLFHNASNGNAQDTLSGGSFAFTDANAGTGNRTVTASGVAVNDGNAARTRRSSNQPAAAEAASNASVKSA